MHLAGTTSHAVIHLLTAVNIQRIEPLNDSVARLTGVGGHEFRPPRASIRSGGLVAFAQRDGVTRRAVPDAAAQVVPLGDA